MKRRRHWDAMTVLAAFTTVMLLGVQLFYFGSIGLLLTLAVVALVGVLDTELHR